MKATMKDVFYHALLARAGYMLAENRKENFKLDEVSKYLQEDPQTNMTSAMADYLVSKFDFVKVADDDDVGVGLKMPTIPVYPATPMLEPKINGYNGMIFKSKTDSNHYVLVNRGTEFDIGGFERFVSTFSDLWSDGNLAMEGDNDQSNSMKEFLKQAKKDGIIPADATITTTGHSLGGFLSSMAIKDGELGISWAYGYNGAGYRPDANLLGKAAKALESIDEVKEIYEYYKNNTGKELPKLEQFFDDPRLGKAAKLLSRFKILVSLGYVTTNNIFDALGWKPLSIEGNMTNVMTEEGLDIVAGTGVKVGETRDIIADLPLGASPIDQHSIVPLTDAFVYAYLLDAIGNDSSLESFNRVVKAFSLMPGDKLTGLFEYLAKSFEYGSDLNKTLKDLKGSEKAKESAVGDIQTFLFKQIKDFEDTPSSNIKIYHLFNSDSNILIDNAFDKTDNGKLMRHALLNHSAISFNLKSTYGDKSKLSKILGNDSYSYDKFVVNDEDYDKESEYEFFKNLVAMSQMVYENNMMKKHQGFYDKGVYMPHDYNDSGNRLYINHWRDTENLQNPYVMFEDINVQFKYERAGKNLDSYANSNYDVTFIGSHFGDTSTFVSNGDDRLYGLDGDDTLEGGEGDDYIDGGEGSDTLYGDKGEDIIYGGKGEDKLYGGDDDDTLIGGINEKNVKDDDAQNELYGEAGNDTLKGSGRLEGGKDYDKYYAYDTATVKDEDGKGELYYNDKRLTGSHMTIKLDSLRKPDSLDFSKDGYDMIDKSTGRLEEIARTKTSVTYLLKGDNNFVYKNKLTTENLIYEDKEDLGIKFYVTVTTEDDPKPPFTPPKNPPTRSDPLVLDLDGNGVIDTVNLGLGVNFDLDGDKFAEKTSWVSAQDGFVVLDINNNGRIDNGSELFGTDTLIQGTDNKASDGFLALAQHDNNSDGIINEEDEVFDKLKIWQDKNQDGISQHTELTGLKTHGIYEISTSGRSVDFKDSNQVIHVNQGVFKQFKDDTHKTGLAETLLFEVDSSNTIHTNASTQSDLSAEILELPDLMGYGTVKSLHASMQEDETGVLKSLVQSFVSTPKDKHLDLVHNILLHWTGKQHISPTAKTYYNEGMQSQQFEILKSLWGKDVEWKNWPPHHTAARELEKHYQNVLKSAYSQLLLQTNDELPFDLITYTKEFVYKPTSWKNGTAEPIVKNYTGVSPEPTPEVPQWMLSDEIWHADFELVINHILDMYTSTPDGVNDKINTLLHVVRGLDINNSALKNEFFAQVNKKAKDLPSEQQHKLLEMIYQLDDELTGTEESDKISSFGGNDSIVLGDGDDVADGGEGDDHLQGEGGNDHLEGNLGNDTLIGGTGGDTLIGGIGNDHLDGGEGNNAYVFNLGDGNDTIYSHYQNKYDTIEFTQGIHSEQVILKRISNNLVITYSEQDQVAVQNFFGNNGLTENRINQVKFADGTIWTAEDIKNLIAQGTIHDDNIWGYDNEDDVLHGREGNDRLYGKGGNDTLIGGTGNDQLEGGAGNDTYVLELGDGKDIINSHDSDANKLDNIVFGKNINPEQVTLKRDHNHLVITYSEQDQVIVQHFFDANGATNHRIDQIQFANGVVWNVNDIKDKVLQATQGNDVIQGYASDDTLKGLDGNDKLIGNAGNDTLIGGTGNDQLEGGAGDDVYVFNLGDGKDVISSYDGNINKLDKIVFGENINPEQVILKRIDNNLVITYSEQDRITIPYFFDVNGATNHRIDQIQFANGVVWNVDNIKDKVLQATESDDVIQGYASDDILTGLDGNDRLTGNAGNDTLIGGTGNDQLEGGAGNNTYLFSLGDGKDTIYSYYQNKYDTIEFAQGIHADEVLVTRNYNDLVITYSEQDSVTVNGFFDNNGLTKNRINQVKFTDGTIWTAEDIKNLIAQGTIHDDNIWGYDNEDDVLHGREGNDRLYGKGGNDTLIGGIGNDHLDGGEGNNTYVFNLGDGNDTIYSHYQNKHDTIEFTQGIHSEQVILKRIDSNLVITYSEQDSVTINGFFDNNGPTKNRINQVKFTDGTIWTVEDIKNLIAQGTVHNDSIWGYDNEDDVIYGREGDDRLYGKSGNDTLIGGDGNDALEGGSGDDAYVFGRDWGQDIVKEREGVNVLYFKDINPESLAIYKDKKNMVIWQAKTENRVTINDYFIDDTTPNINQNVIDVIRFDGGIEWNGADILSKLLQGNIDNDTLHGFDGDDHITGNAGNDTLYGKKGNDFLEGGDDNDTLYGNEGDDTLYGNDGDDTLDGGEGDDVLYGDDGNDILSDTHGNNTLIGGRGYDVYHIHGTTNTLIDDKDGMIYVDGNLTYIPWGSWGKSNGTGYHGMSGYESLKLTEDGHFLYKVGKVGHYEFSNNHNRLGKFIYDSNSQTLAYEIHRWQYPNSPYGSNGKAHTNNYFTITNFDINQMDDLSVYVEGVDLNLTGEHNNYHATQFSLRDFISQGEFEAHYSNTDDVINDIAGAGFGDKIIYAKDGSDVINLNDNAFKVQYYDNGQSSASHVGFVSVYAGNGDDAIVSTGHNPYVKIYGEAGDDTIQAAFGNQIDAGEGDDTVHLDYGDVYGGDGNDTITIYKGTADGGLGDDVIAVINNPKTTHLPYYAYGNIKLIGGAGNDTLTGGNGNDWLEGGAGADTLVGGLGDDIYIVDEFDTYLEEGKDLEGGYDTIHIASNFDLSSNNFEAITLLGDGNFSVIGDEFDNQIIGNVGNNHLMGGAGNDTISGGDGNDHLDGGLGTDTLTGGLGNDHYILDSEFDTITEHFDEGIDTLEQHTDRPFYNFDEFGNPIKTGSYSLLFDNVENLILKGTATTAFGNHLDNTITLNEQSNFVNALSGNDTIIYQKGGGKDTILSTDNINSKDSLVIEGYDLSEASFVRVKNTASTHDMLQIRFKGSNDQITLIDYFAPSSQKDVSHSIFNEYGEWVNETTTVEQDNKIDQISFKKDGVVTTLSQSEFEAKIIAQSQNAAPKVNKYPKPITAHIGKELLVQFDKDTIKDADPYDSELSYKITLAAKDSQGQYQPIPEWLSFDPATLTLTGTPPEGTKGNLQFILWGEDSFNYSAGAFVNLSIANAPSTDTTTTPKPTNPATPQTGNLIKDTKGNDTLKGDGKDTTFVYTGGKDTLTDTGGKDTLVFGSGITFNQVGQGLMQSGNDLILRVNGSTANQITLKNFFADQSSIIETIKFETGGQIDYKQIYNLFGKTVPTDTPTPTTNDTTTPTTPTVSPQNNFVGTNKADKLTGTDHHDQLQGNAGNDTLTGKAGNDILIGGTGNDTLMGGTGNDLYYFTKGFGKDTLINTGGGYDNIYFDGISFNQVGSGLTKSGNNLILKVKGATDELTLKDFFLGGDNANLNIHFKDGGSISNTGLLNAFKSTKTPTHTDTQSFNASLEIALGLMEGFKSLNTDIAPIV